MIIDNSCASHKKWRFCRSCLLKRPSSVYYRLRRWFTLYFASQGFLSTGAFWDSSWSSTPPCIPMQKHTLARQLSDVFIMQKKATLHGAFWQLHCGWAEQRWAPSPFLPSYCTTHVPACLPKPKWNIFSSESSSTHQCDADIKAKLQPDLPSIAYADLSKWDFQGT